MNVVQYKIGVGGERKERELLHVHERTDKQCIH